MAVFGVAFALALRSGERVGRPRRAGRLRMGWGPDPVWSELSVASISEEADGLKAITVIAPPETVKGSNIC